jgi:hypothetical protein
MIRGAERHVERCQDEGIIGRDAVVQAMAVGLVIEVWRNGPVEDMHASRRGPSDAAMFAESTALHKEAVKALTAENRGFGLLDFVDRPGLVGGSDTWKGEGLWRLRGSTRLSCRNAQFGWFLSSVSRLASGPVRSRVWLTSLACIGRRCGCGCARARSTTRESYLRSRASYTPLPDYWQTWQNTYQADDRGVQLELSVLWNRYTGQDLQPDSDRAGKIRKAVTSTPHAKAIPEAHSTAQRILETSLLLMIRESQSPAGDKPYRGHQVFRTVSPRRDKLIITLHEKAMRWLFRAMLTPVQPHGGMDGIPGLRIVPQENALDLRLLDHTGACTDALVVINNTGAERWRKTWPNIRDSVHYDGGCVDPLLSTSPQLSHGERAGIEFHRHSCGPVALGSAFLRRFGLISCAYAVDVWTGGEGRDLHIEIDQGPSIPTLAKALADPVFGLVGGPVSIVNPLQSHIRVQDTRATPDRYIGRENPPRQPPALILRSLDPSPMPSAMPGPVTS